MQAKEVSQIEVKNDKFPEASAGAFLNLENLLKIEKKMNENVSSRSEKSLCLKRLLGDNHIHSENSLQFTFVTSINNSTILKRICTNIYDTRNNITDMSRLSQDFDGYFQDDYHKNKSARVKELYHTT